MPTPAPDLGQLSGQLGYSGGLPNLDYATLLGLGNAPTPTAPSQLATPDFGAAPGPGLITSPEQVPNAGEINTPLATPAPATALPSVGVGVGTKTAVSGYSPAANAAIQAGPGKQINQRLSKEDQAANAEYAPIQAEQAAATKAEQEAATNTAGIEAQKLVASSEAKQKIAAANNDFMAKEQAAMQNAQAEAATTFAQYKTALADWAAAKVNPAQLWDSAGAGGQFAMIATAFAHDFLGAKGIQTSGLDSINKAIQNNINAQLENINKKQGVAQGFKSLWEMQRQQSSSDAEARARINGFYLAGLSNQIESTLGGYDSKLALAKGQAAVAALTQAQVKNDLVIKKHIDDAANQRAEQRIKVYGIDMAASTAKLEMENKLKIAEMGKQPKSAPGFLIDTTQSGSNTVVRKFMPTVSPDKQVELQQNYSKALNTVENIHKLVDLQKQLKGVLDTAPGDITIINKLKSESARVAETLRSLVMMGIIYDASGKQINEQEVKTYRKIVDTKDWWTNGDNTRQFAELGTYIKKKTDESLDGVTVEVQPGQEGYGMSTGTKHGGAALDALNEVRSGPNGGEPQETDVNKYRQWATAPNATQAISLDELPDKGNVTKASVGHDWQQFTSEQPVFAPQTDTDLARRAGKSVTSNPAAIDKSNPDRAFIQLERLADLALQGDKEAKDTIDIWASGKASTADAQGLLAAYAQWEKQTKGL